jgi:hypothetical protein
VKKRTKIILLTLLTVIGLTILHFLYGVFTPYNYFSAKWDIYHNKPRILVYGEPMLSDQQAVKVAPKFGFKFDIVAGCLVTTPLVNGVDAYNSVTRSYLKNKLGSDWENKFDLEVDSLFRVERTDTIQ